MSEWIDAKTRFPCGSGRYLVVRLLCVPNSIPYVDIGFYYANRHTWHFIDEELSDDRDDKSSWLVTHWMPLPPLPGEEVT